ncbi:hypothetical protein D0T25_29300 [Duganella sp. BJB488]|uniref:hypothetical protein n=2 Tax=Duganella TaxID=75654 RepID=UPI000EC6095F|nr:hypothetical protein [Duganella sp. BJB488]RFP13001.1 hypothetical protein D0T25_29300 [Duganella sp. BJB488]
MRSLRFWSLMLGAVSIVPMIYFAYQNWMFSQWAKEQASAGNFVCGTGMFALLALCIVAGGAFSALGSLLSLIGYFRMEKPRPRIRIFETALVGCILVVAMVAAFVFFA